MLIDTTTIYNKISEMSINKPNFMPYLLKKQILRFYFYEKKKKRAIRRKKIGIALYCVARSAATL